MKFVTAVPAAASPQKDELSRFGVTPEDIRQLAALGKFEADTLKELKALSSASTPPNVKAPATLTNQFMARLDRAKVESCLETFQQAIKSRSLIFVVPAAGAASRQFQLLRTICKHPAFVDDRTLEEVQARAEQIVASISGNKQASGEDKATLKIMQEVAQNLPRFWKAGILNSGYAFLDDLQVALKTQGLSLGKLIAERDIKTLGDAILSEQGLNYSFLPKALMRFHSYKQADGPPECRLAVEEHIRLAAKLMKGASDLKLHFIISEEHQAHFEQALGDIKAKPGFVKALQTAGFTLDKLSITYDFQSPATDSVSLDIASGAIARTSSGQVALRKSGHGALLPNLSNLAADGMWLQNIDNVVYENPQIQGVAILYKQIMAGLAIQLEQRAHGYLEELGDPQRSARPGLSSEIVKFLREDLLIDVEPMVAEKLHGSEGNALLRQLLNRPVMVAGYVPLEPGQAGGGPFVLETRDRSSGLTLRKVSTVEGSEFPEGQNSAVFKSGEFFNPVNLFLSRRDPRGARHDLTTCVNTERCFTAEKTDSQGRPIRVYELPGLWNGSLEFASQVSIPTPASTFAAVKDCAGRESFLSELHRPFDGTAIGKLDRDRQVVDGDLERYLTTLASRI